MTDRDMPIFGRRLTVRRRLRNGFLAMAAFTVVLPALQLWETTGGYDVYAAAMLTLAEANRAIGYGADAGQAVRLENGETAVATIAEIVEYGPWRARREALLGRLSSGAWIGAKLGFCVALALFGWSGWRERRRRRRLRLQGSGPVAARELRRSVSPLWKNLLDASSGDPGAYRAGGVPWPGGAETRHTFVSGRPGTGRRAFVEDLLRQIRARGERCIVHDRSGQYTAAFFDPARDVLLNPQDARGPRWSPFFEARGEGDFLTMATALIPEPQDAEQRIRAEVARRRFADTAAGLWAEGRTAHSALAARLLHGDVRYRFGGGAAQPGSDPWTVKDALSVDMMLSDTARALEMLPDAGAPFSIGDWIGEDRGDGFLFLGSRGDRFARPVDWTGTWLEIAVNALRCPDRRDGRRLWVIVDDLASPAPVPGLEAALAEGPSFGGCFVLGAAVFAALRQRYGDEAAKRISRQCATRVAFAAPDRETAQWAARGLGTRDIDVLAACPDGEGVGVTPLSARGWIVTPERLMRLGNGDGYLKMPGPVPVARVRVRRRRRTPVAPAFVPRPPGPAFAVIAAERDERVVSRGSSNDSGERGRSNGKDGNRLWF